MKIFKKIKMKRLEKMTEILIKEFESEMKKLNAVSLFEIDRTEETNLNARRQIALDMRKKTISTLTIALKDVKNQLVNVIDNTDFL